ncbi:hypothetical protein OHB12_26380 [Nocardia sp. NBC_01730]|uniref:hypothetical protein n=1 Tax=Nocardia sp. NBC_01730 TaxID=2975998 RepID=UPI002E149CCD|nr:hypothetical protein OHB12_26380 [Nocardia sp. NBC_01730]
MRISSCLSCESTIDHCHGTLIVHVNRIAECTDEECIDLNHARHTFVVDCGALAGSCRCISADVASRPS